MSQRKHTTDAEIIQSNRRLLFAVARGARWRIFLGETRIHPGDEHLQYGPISTALREMAEDDSWNPSWEHYAAHAVEDRFSLFDRQQWWLDEPDYPLFYLFLAEFLADSGL